LVMHLHKLAILLCVLGCTVPDQHTPAARVTELGDNVYSCSATNVLPRL